MEGLPAAGVRSLPREDWDLGPPRAPCEQPGAVDARVDSRERPCKKKHMFYPHVNVNSYSSDARPSSVLLPVLRPGAPFVANLAFQRCVGGRESWQS